MAIDQRVMEIADKAAEGTAPSREDVLHLLSFDEYSVEASYVCAIARQMATKAGKGLGLIHAQIGVDAYPCPENCRFCTFAAINYDADKGYSFDSAPEVPLEHIAAIAKTFDEEGAHLISLMATAGLPFERYLEMVRATRAAVSPEMLIMVNAADMTLEEAKALKDAGAQVAYHARRVLEGELTDIEPALREQTIANIHEVGLALMTGVEPLWEGIDPEELADRIMEIPAFKPYCTGACTLSPAKDTEMEHEIPSSTSKVRYVAAIVRLVCGYDVPFGGVGGAIWVDAGADPRGRGYEPDHAYLRSLVHRARRTLTRDGWDVPAHLDPSFLTR
ncbi:MAG: hypothetical protein IKV48_03585 [Eggerthellaceae bacterium]|nr:hypothetical protein [Eggerthellaceae bacterium]